MILFNIGILLNKFDKKPSACCFDINLLFLAFANITYRFN